MAISPLLWLLIAAACEVGWAVGLKYTNGLTRPWPSAITVVLMLLSFVFLAQATKQLPIGTAYAAWTGIGAAATAILGIFLFKEPTSAWRLFFLALLVVSVVGLKVTAK
jgi:quaternary ammonium compound-resistance protein SugE